MTSTKLLTGQDVVVFAIVVAGVWFVTQRAAAMTACQTYGAKEPIIELIPAMLAAFLDGDRDFARRQK